MINRQWNRPRNLGSKDKKIKRGVSYMGFLNKTALSLFVLFISTMFVASASVNTIPLENGASAGVGNVLTMAGNGTVGNGTVYTENNNATNNRIIRFERGADGSLKMSGSFSTHGKGTGTSLGNEGGVILTDDGKYLLAVNAGSNEISVFQVRSNGLKLTDKIRSGGIMPISLTAKYNLVYVVNTGGTGGNGNIAGFHLRNGKLSKIPNSIRPLSKKSAGPAEISFNPAGNVLVVTEKSTNIIDTYTVGRNEIAKGPFKMSLTAQLHSDLHLTQKDM
jgi:6-phosphogluconolactonase (cycloisomerase 2 family)